MAKKIMIIEDDPIERDLVLALVRREGYDAVAATTGEEGLAMVKDVAPDLIVLDTKLPGIDGFEVCRCIRELRLAKEPRVIITTGKVDAIDPTRARQSGADDYIAKTADFEHLAAAIARLIGAPQTMAARMVLIVEDSPTALEMLKEVLAGEGYGVCGAATGEEGVRMAGEVGPDLMIIDTVLPDTDGFEVCRRVRARTMAKQPKVIITTGKVDAVDAGKARRAGADDYIVKTDDFSYLLATVKKII